MAMSSITVRVDEDTKVQASRIAEYFGLDLSSVTRAFYKQMVREQRIPLDFSVSTEPNDESLASIAAANEMATQGGKGYRSADEMFKAMGV